jgi:hypothetical protein
MGNTSKGKRKHRRELLAKMPTSAAVRPKAEPSELARLPVNYQEITDYYDRLGEAQPFALRRESFLRIEAVTGRPLICYVARTANVTSLAVAIDDSDLVGFTDLAHSVPGNEVDVLIESNGGSPEAAERIVRLLRARFRSIRFLVPGNAYSAATLVSFSGDSVVMSSMATLGPIDPQVNGIPARAILNAFATLEARLAREGPKALAAYVPLIAKYDLHLLEICKTAEELSKELAGSWLSQYMLKCPADDPRITSIVDYFASYDEHKSHSRSIDREKSKELGLAIENAEDTAGLADLIRSLHNQYAFWFDKTPFVKMFEDARGICWGRQQQNVSVQPPFGPAPQPGPPQRTN